MKKLFGCVYLVIAMGIAANVGCSLIDKTLTDEELAMMYLVEERGADDYEVEIFSNDDGYIGFNTYVDGELVDVGTMINRSYYTSKYSK